LMPSAFEAFRKEISDIFIQYRNSKEEHLSKFLSFINFYMKIHEKYLNSISRHIDSYIILLLKLIFSIKNHLFKFKIRSVYFYQFTNVSSSSSNFFIN
jgi:hypothetical protein